MQNDFLDKLVSAVAHMEGAAVAGSIPQVRHNPGNLRYAHQANATRPDGSTLGNLAVEPIAEFRSTEAGICALYRDLLAKIAQGQTLRQLIYVYAPPSDGNDTAAYLANVLTWTGITNPDQKLIELLSLDNLK